MCIMSVYNMSNKKRVYAFRHYLVYQKGLWRDSERAYIHQ